MATVDLIPETMRLAAGHHGPVTLALYDRMIAAGVFEPAEQHRFELITGKLQMMSPIGDPHADAVAWLTRWTCKTVDLDKVLPWVQNQISIPDSDSVPQPDLSWVLYRRYADRRPLPGEVMLLIEVADTSLEYDLTTKAALYAAAGIRDYWVVDLVGHAIVVFRDPRGGCYETRSTHRAGSLLKPLAFPQCGLDPATLFLPAA